ncbi:uncharacterized protein LOC112494496 isoform X2 [Cephus cinctus]|uniref:Uncharacterized protein LOC112494496 isoform X2 n=1 Tax=Cephus cinctus TaxID=211228 RepID=A0AAJ7W2M3_CEPCN|nr:uncharacterized protein LOC112494496 isoform X2 [Cephus cinctus]
MTHKPVTVAKRLSCACKPISTKRLQRKGVKSRGCGRKHCGTNCVCSCNRCKKYSSFQKKRVLNTNFLADLAYNHRVSRNQEIVGSQLDNEGKLNKDSNRISIQDPSQDLIKDHRDVSIPKKNGQEWWTSLKHQYMPPLSQGYPEPTRSDCSSVTSGFRSEIPNSFTDSLSVLKSVSAISNLSHTREGLKSESRIECPVGRDHSACARKPSKARTKFRRRSKRNTRRLLGVGQKIGKRKIFKKNYAP